MLYYEDFSWRSKFGGSNFMSLNEQSRESLERRFSKEKILEHLMQCRKGKAIGPDGSNMGFL